MDFQLVSEAVLVVYGVLALAAAMARRPQWLLVLLMFALSNGTFSAYLWSTLWIPVKVVGVVIVLYVAFVDHRWIAPTKKYAPLLTPALVAIVLAACVAYLIEPSVAVVGHGAQSRLLRPAVQTGSYVANLVVIPLALAGVNRKRDMERLVTWYIWAAAAASLAAITQLVLLHMGKPFVPILRMAGQESQDAEFYLGSAAVSRLYGLAGEPKMLASFMVPACCIVLAALKEPRSSRPRWARVDLLVVFTMVTVLTFSTAGLIALAVALPLVAIRVGKFRSLAALRVAMTVVILFVASRWFFTYATREVPVDLPTMASADPSLEGALYTRSVGRLDDELRTRNEYRALSYITNERPIGLLLGLGPGMYNFHLPWLHWGGGIEPIDSGWVVLLLDLGVIGTGLLLAWILSSLRRALRRTTAQTAAGGLIAPETRFAAAGLIGSVCANAGAGAFPAICLFLALLETSMRFRAAAPTWIPTDDTYGPARDYAAAAHA